MYEDLPVERWLHAIVTIYAQSMLAACLAAGRSRDELGVGRLSTRLVICLGYFFFGAIFPIVFHHPQSHIL